jgi:hypothetical protein
MINKSSTDMLNLMMIDIENRKEERAEAVRKELRDDKVRKEEREEREAARKIERDEFMLILASLIKK